MRYHILILLVFLFAANSFSQSKLDSLLAHLEKIEQSNDVLKIAKTNYAIGDELKKRNPKKAILHYKKAESIYIDSNKALPRANVVNNIGWCKKELGMNEEALLDFETALKIFRKEKYQKGEANVLNNMGTMFRRGGDYQKALKYLTQASEISRDLGNDKVYANNCGNIGNIYLDLGDFKKANEYFQIALKLHQKLGLEKAIGYDYGNIAIIYSEQGSHLKSLEYHQKALEISTKTGGKYTQGINLENIAIEYAELAEEHSNQPQIRDSLLNQAYEHFKKALKTCTEIQDKAGIAANTSNLSSFLKSCAQYYKNTNDKIHDSLIQASLEYVYLADQLYTENGRLYSLTISKNSLASNYRILATRLKKGEPLQSQYLDSTDYYAKKSYEIASDIGSVLRKEDALRNLGSVNWFKGNMKNAFSYLSEELQLIQQKLKSNFSFISESEKENFMNEQSDVFMKFYSFAIEYSEKEPSISRQVYDNILLTKGLLLKSSTAMRNIVLNSKDSSLIKDYEQWLKLKKQIDGLYAVPERYRKQNIKLLEDKADSLESNLVAKSTDFSDFNLVLDNQWKDVRNKLKTNEAAIEFLRYREFDGKGINDFNDTYQYCALLIKKNFKQPLIIKLFSEENLIEIIDVFGGNNKNYVEKIYGKKDGGGSKLFELIWKPIQKELEGIKTIYYSPDGLLHKVSFSGIRNSQNIYLASQYKLQRIGSTSNINPTLKALHQHAKISIFGGINYNKNDQGIGIWGYLEGTKTEAEKIQKILLKKKFEVNLFEDLLASEFQFKSIASNSDILHVATHGFFYPDPEQAFKQLETEVSDVKFRGGDRGQAMSSFVKSSNPMIRSGLVFANANAQENKGKDGNDGVLTALEVAHIDMRKTRLVVMSACETGLGDIQGSEGVYGLQRAFKMAGCKNIIMSLWQVPDKETAEFMATFYSKLVDGNPIEEAFRATQLKFSKKYDPYFWAAFVLLR